MFRGPYFILSTIQAGTTPIFNVFGMTGPSTKRKLNPEHHLVPAGKGGSRGGGGPPRFWGTPKLHKEGKTLRACAEKRRVLVLNSYPDLPFPKSCVRPWWGLPYHHLVRSAGATEGLFVTRELHQEPPPEPPLG